MFFIKTLSDFNLTLFNFLTSRKWVRWCSSTKIMVLWSVKNYSWQANYYQALAGGSNSK